MATIAVWDIEVHADADDAPDDSCVVQFEINPLDDLSVLAEQVATAVEEKWGLDEGSIVKFYWHVCEGEHEYDNTDAE